MSSICDVPGIFVGHTTDLEAATGCTVVLVEPAAVASVDVRGSAPGTRETDLLQPGTLVQAVNAILLTGGSAFGLGAADGVMRWLEERGRGFKAPAGPVPIVPAAVLYDLNIGNVRRPPDAAAGYAACEAASTIVEEGCVGAGTGATFAKISGRNGIRKGGIGTASATTFDGFTVGAIVAVNAVGTVVAANGTDMTTYEPTEMFPPDFSTAQEGTNTTIAVVATDAKLDKASVRKIAEMAHDGMAHAIRPAHTLYDGDTIFAVATATRDADINLSGIGALAADVLATAIRRAVLLATPLGGIPAVRENPLRGVYSIER